MAESGAWTIRRILLWMAKDFAARGIDTARLDAELLVAHALGVDRVALYLDMDRPLREGELTGIRALVKRRREREPVAYILGRREFYGRTFEVSPAVLVPRPDTETLVERALSLVGESDSEQGEPGTEQSDVPRGSGVRFDRQAQVLDLCTGSGIVGVTVAAECPHARVDATDLSADALEVARRNAECHGVADRIEWLEGDLFDAVPPGRTYAVVTANPPYIAEGAFEGLQPEVARWEPRVALAAGADGLDVLRRIAREVGALLEPGGHVLVEVGQGQAPAVAHLFTEHGLEMVAIHKDLAGIERVVEAKKGG